MGCHSERHKRLVELRGLKGCGGQATVEFAVVLAGVFAVVLACGLLWRALDRGLFVEHALMSASHHVESGLAGAVVDVFVF